MARVLLHCCKTVLFSGLRQTLRSGSLYRLDPWTTTVKKFFISRDGGFAQTIFVLLKIGRIAFSPHNYCKALTVGNMLSLCSILLTKRRSLARLLELTWQIHFSRCLRTLRRFARVSFFNNLTSSYPDSAHSTKTCHASVTWDQALLLLFFFGLLCFFGSRGKK